MAFFCSQSFCVLFILCAGKVSGSLHVHPPFCQWVQSNACALWPIIAHISCNVQTNGFVCEREGSSLRLKKLEWRLWPWIMSMSLSISRLEILFARGMEISFDLR